MVGGTYNVFPGACHQRFEHSLGVAHLASIFLNQLCLRQPELEVSEEEKLCVSLAGLCHDLGHGVLSHFFEGFICRIRGEAGWKHEHASVAMLTHLIERNELKPYFDQYGITDDHIHLVQEIIFGSPADSPTSWNWRGPPAGKEFLFEIVANHRTSIDVDKFDYFARDCHQLGIPKTFDASRLMKFSKVVVMDGKSEIAYHKKEAWNIYELFHCRYSLHKRAYQHRVAGVIELMFQDVLELAEPFLTVPGKNNVPTTIGDAIDDMKAYTALTDYIFKRIEFSTENKLQPARDLLYRIHRRNLYAFVGEQVLAPGDIFSNDFMNEIKSFLLKDSSLLSEDNIIIRANRFDFGMKDKNPVERVHFYQSKKPMPMGVSTALSEPAFKIEGKHISHLRPVIYQEIYVRVYCKKNDDKRLISELRSSFAKWCKQYDVKESGK
eukprot:g2209.t1